MTMISLLVVLALVGYASAVPLPGTCGTTPIAPDLSNTVTPKVVGGKEAIPNSWPWQMQVRYNGGHYCGASILSNDWMLCAAHCVFGNAAASYSLRAGRHTRTGTNEPNEQISSVRTLIPHESYSSSSLDNDVSLIRLTTALTFNNYVQPVCLTNSEPAAGTDAWLSGWGNVAGTCCDGKLKQALLPIIARSQCSAALWWGSNITPGMVCAGYADGSQGACNGDSGGPLVVKTGGLFYQVGTVSWGHRTCDAANKPPVFGNVNYYKTWITSKITMVEKEEEEMQARKFHPRLGAAFRAFAKSLEE
jgi:secreted trypsin-like serine protease